MKYPELKFGKTIIVYDEKSNNIIKRTYEVKEGIKNGYEVIYSQNIVKRINLWHENGTRTTVFKNKIKLNKEKYIPVFRIEKNSFFVESENKYTRKGVSFFSSDYTNCGIELIIIVKQNFLLPLWER